LYGHGVQNMKGGLASIIMSAEAIRRSGVRLAGDLRTDAAVVAEPFGADNLVTYTPESCTWRSTRTG
jgi:acetylornithine deacetylase